LRVREAGYRVVWTPFAELHHYESVSRGPDSAPDKVERFNGEARYMRRRWGELLVNDPFHNPNFTNYAAELRLAFPPRRPHPWIRSFQSVEEKRGSS
ncbi:glycosyltransferase family 2 protein, partial [Starkeya nomas]|uniref:glycosyltransferase family 2 protein n=1 Tax=Starkeya nomas TaxID=2666134 RepID=UPI003BF5AA04